MDTRENARKRYAALRKAGLCVRCRGERAASTIYCEGCASEKNARRVGEFRANRAMGLCRCGGVRLEGRMVCSACSAKRRARKPEDRARRRERSRQEVYEHYGKTCACCGESEPKFLQIDHINGGGKAHRKTLSGRTLAEWLVSSGFPGGFQILCANCNWAKGIHGRCPHQP